MRFFTQGIDYQKRDGGHRRRFSMSRRYILHWSRNDQSNDVSVQVTFRTASKMGAGFQFRCDGPWAGSPLDAYLGLFWLQLYFSTSLGRRLNRWLRVPDGSREVSLEVFRLDGGPWTLTWTAWTSPDDAVMSKWQKAQVSWWYRIRRGYLHPIDRLLNVVFGRTVYELVDVAETTAIGWMPEGGYPLRLTLQRQTWKRPRAWWRRTRTSVEFAVISQQDGGPGFCPTGKVSFGEDDGLVSSSVAVTEVQAASRTAWQAQGVAGFVSAVLRDRDRYTGRLKWAPTGDAVPPNLVTIAAAAQP